ncbi:MAG TPA: NADH-quinone oxidoreductase subunit N [Actinomycetota bacterium]|jgi:NADH-quinone oxidoreductase subunit N|nr:NADH-quinone oxidoreductase subunit N [Actinomycetota bacterium]
MPQGLPVAENWTVLLPELVLVGGAILLLLVDAAVPNQRGPHLQATAFITLLAAAVVSFKQWGADPRVALSGMVVGDGFGVFARWVILGAGALATLTARGYLVRRGIDKAEFYALLLLSTAGMTLLAVSTDLIMVFVSVELLSLALYVMAGFERARPAAQEASMKYFLLGAFASAFLLYGIAFIFGGAGTTNLLRIKSSVAIGGLDDFRLAGVAVALLAVGLGFKAAMVPFHMWTPDAYQGAPTPVTAFMAGGTKAAAFASLVRVLVVSLPELRWDWQPPLAVLAVVTIAFASVLAVAQTDIKRMLAYSSIAHAGFIAIAVVATSRSGIAAAMLYLLVYTAMTIGAFASVMLFLEDGGTERVHLTKYSGVGVRRPAAAALFAFFLFSLAGIPPTGGFWAKWYVFFAAIRAHYAWLAVIAVLASVVAAFFYVRVAVVMFMQDPDESDDMPLERSAGLRIALAACAAIVIATGIAPGFFLSLAERALPLGG